MRPFGFLFKESKELYWSVRWAVLSFDSWEWMKRRSDILFSSSSDSHPSFDLRANSANFLRLIHPFDDPENARQMHHAAWTQCRGLQAQRGWPLKASNWAKRKWRECVKLTHFNFVKLTKWHCVCLRRQLLLLGPDLKGVALILIIYGGLMVQWQYHIYHSSSPFAQILVLYQHYGCKQQHFIVITLDGFFGFFLSLGVSLLLCSSFFTQQFFAGSHSVFVFAINDSMSGWSSLFPHSTKKLQRKKNNIHFSI